MRERENENRNNGEVDVGVGGENGKAEKMRKRGQMTKNEPDSAIKRTPKNGGNEVMAPK